jgi:hypothetical protein
MITGEMIDRVRIGIHGHFGMLPDAPEPLDDITLEEMEAEQLKDMTVAISFNSEEIARELMDAEAIQEGNESQYTKEQAKLTAYNHIIELVKEG